jgi:hypothetical protein
MPVPKIYLIWQHALLRESVEAILQQSGLALAGSGPDLPGEAELQAQQPDVIIFEEQPGLTEQFLTRLSASPSPRLICISMDNNKLYIYQRQERDLHHMQDLVAAVQEP